MNADLADHVSDIHAESLGLLLTDWHVARGATLLF